MDQTKRGEQDREREKEVMEGESTDARAAGAGAQPANTTRDKGVAPTPDTKRGDQSS